ncbi:hypothetical protein AMTRI_Chr12g236800 [Amborella trichopoda]
MNLKVGVTHLRITFLSPQSCTFAYKLGGTIIGTSRGGHDTPKIVDSIQDRGINQKIGRHGLKVSVAGIPKTIDNDIAVIDKSFGFDTAVEEAQRAMNAAHVEVGSVDNGLGIVKLMGRYSEFIAMYATLASRDVDCCLIPESPFYLEGEGGLFDFIEKRLKENGHMVIVLEEGAWQELVAQSMRAVDETDASGNQLHHDVGLWLAHNVKVINYKKVYLHISKIQKINQHLQSLIGIAIRLVFLTRWEVFKCGFYLSLGVMVKSSGTQRKSAGSSPESGHFVHKPKVRTDSSPPLLRPWLRPFDLFTPHVSNIYDLRLSLHSDCKSVTVKF